jgi:hypothetical protein
MQNQQFFDSKFFQLPGTNEYYKNQIPTPHLYTAASYQLKIILEQIHPYLTQAFGPRTTFLPSKITYLLIPRPTHKHEHETIKVRTYL